MRPASPSLLPLPYSCAAPPPAAAHEQRSAGAAARRPRHRPPRRRTALLSLTPLSSRSAPRSARTASPCSGCCPAPTPRARRRASPRPRRTTPCPRACSRRSGSPPAEEQEQRGGEPGEKPSQKHRLFAPPHKRALCTTARAHIITAREDGSAAAEQKSALLSPTLRVFLCRTSLDEPRSVQSS